MIENGVIIVDKENGIGTSAPEVAKLIGAATTDYGTVCEHPNINPLAKYKPVDNTDVVGELTEQQRQAKNYGTYVPPIEVVETLDKLIVTTPQWSHEKPTVIHRIADFVGYPINPTAGNTRRKGYTHKKVAPIHTLFGGGTFDVPAPPDWKNLTERTAFLRCGIALKLNNDELCVNLKDVLNVTSAYQSGAYNNMYIWYCIVNGTNSYCKRSAKTVAQIMSDASGIDYMDFQVRDGYDVNGVQQTADFNGALQRITGDYTFLVMVGERVNDTGMVPDANNFRDKNISAIEGALSLNALNHCDRFDLNYTIASWQEGLSATYDTTLTYISTSGGYKKYRLSDAVLTIMRKQIEAYATENFAYKVYVTNYTFGNGDTHGYIGTIGVTTKSVVEPTAIRLGVGESKDININLNNENFDLFVPDGGYGEIGVRVEVASNTGQTVWQSLVSKTFTQQF